MLPHLFILSGIKLVGPKTPCVLQRRAVGSTYVVAVRKLMDLLMMHIHGSRSV